MDIEKILEERLPRELVDIILTDVDKYIAKRVADAFVNGCRIKSFWRMESSWVTRYWFSDDTSREVYRCYDCGFNYFTIFRDKPGSTRMDPPEHMDWRKHNCQI